MQRPESLTVLLDHAQDKIVTLDEDGTFTYANAAVERILGFEPGAIVGENAFEYVHPDDVERVREAFERTIGREVFEETTVEYRHRAADGSWVWLESRMSNLTGSELDGYVVSSRDITDRVEAERAREATEGKLREIAAHTGDVLWMFSGDWSELLFINPAYEDVYGMETGELEADPQRFLECVHPDDVPAVEEAMERLGAGESVDMEYRVGPDDEYGRWVWVQGEPIVEDGEVVRIVGFARDITERKHRERQLVVMDNLLRHNLRNEMNVVLGNARLAEEDPGNAAEHTAVIRRVGENLLETAEKQRDIIDLLTGPVVTGRVDLAAAVADAAERVSDRYPDATIVTDLPDAAHADALGEVGFAAEELLENAVEHAGNGAARVEASVREVPDAVELTVADEGPPIPDYEYGVLTGERDMTAKYHSSGLGLWLVYWVVDLSDGDIAFVRRGEDGNTVTVRLPRG